MEKELITEISLDIEQQYYFYKNKVKELTKNYEQLKKESKEISKVFSQMKNDNIIDNHLSKLFALVKSESFKRRNLENENNMQKIIQYFQKVQRLSIDSLKIIFEIRKFFTGQSFDISIENQGRVFSFSIEDIERHAGNIIPIYTDSLEKFISNMVKDSKAAAPELNKLGLTLKNLSSDLELEGLQPYLDFVNYHVMKNKLSISENRKLEAAIYLYGRNEHINFNNKSDRHSLHIILGWYISKGGVRDTITMYKLGDAIRKTENGFKNVEIKMHNGTISLTMIANGIKKLDSAFNSPNVKEKIIKFFGVNKEKLSSPIEKAAEKEAIRNIEDMFKKINIS